MKRDEPVSSARGGAAEPDSSDLVLGLPDPSPEDREALRRARIGAPTTPNDYLRFLRSRREPTADELRRRPLLLGEPFEL